MISLVTTWALVSGLTAVGLEWLYRASTRSWWELLPILVVPALLISYGICQLVRGSASLLDALIIWAVVTAGARVMLSALVLHDTILTSTWLAFGLIVLARVVQGMRF